MTRVLVHIFASILLCLFLAGPGLAKGSSYTVISKNSKIKAALNVLASHSSFTHKTLKTLAGDNVTGEAVKIRFWNLGELNYSYRNLDALTCRDRNNKIVILINSIHKDAPAEAIASLLAHEALHQDEHTSLEEEIQAWMTEAKVWNSFSPELRDKYSNLPLVQRLNRISKMYNNSDNHREEIVKAVYANNYYKNLPKYSPGFGN